MRTHLQNQNSLASLIHGVSPRGIHCLKLFALVGQLFGNICRVENGLEVHPLPLALGPLLQDVRHCFELVVPVHNLVFEWLLERRKLHRLGVHSVLVNDHLNIVVVFDQESVLVRQQVESDGLPDLLHTVETSLNIKLLRCPLSNLNTSVHMLHQVQFKDFAEGETFDGGDFEADLLTYLFPMPVNHSLLL